MLCRDICLRNSPTVLAASQQARANVSLLNSFVSGYDGYLVDSGADHVARGTVSGFNGSLDEHLLNAWYSGLRSYDAIDVQSFGSSSQVGGALAAHMAISLLGRLMLLPTLQVLTSNQMLHLLYAPAMIDLMLSCINLIKPGDTCLHAYLSPRINHSNDN